MEDTAIIDLYWKRDERAIEETDRKYGNYCYTVADNILRSRHMAAGLEFDASAEAFYSARFFGQDHEKSGF